MNIGAKLAATFASYGSSARRATDLFSVAEIKIRRDQGLSHITTGSVPVIGEDDPTTDPSPFNIHESKLAASPTTAGTSTDVRTLQHEMQSLTQQRKEAPLNEAKGTSEAEATTEMSPPHSSTAKVAPTNEESLTRTSSIEIITETPQKSWISEAWANGVNPPQEKSSPYTPIVAEPGWDSAATDMSIPVWQRPAPKDGPTAVAVRANINALAPYQMQRPRKDRDATKEAFERIKLNLQKETSSQENLIRRSPGMQSSPQLQPSPIIQESSQKQILPLPNKPDGNITAANHDGTRNRDSSVPAILPKALPPHLRTPENNRHISKKEESPISDGVKLPPHLRTPASRASPSPKIVETSARATALNRETVVVPETSKTGPLTDTPTVQDHKDENASNVQPELNIDEEIAAGLGNIDLPIHDEEVAASLQIESYSEEAQHPDRRSARPLHAQHTTIPSRARTPGPVTSHNPLQQVSSSRHNSQVSPVPNGTESAVKAGKRPAVVAMSGNVPIECQEDPPCQLTPSNRGSDASTNRIRLEWPQEA